jgi:DNA-binding Xre family transcriptional regulator
VKKSIRIREWVKVGISPEGEIFEPAQGELGGVRLTVPTEDTEKVFDPASPKTLSLKLKKLRESKSMTQDKLAEATGLSQALLSQLESGMHKTLNTKTIKALAKALDVSEDFFI